MKYVAAILLMVSFGAFAEDLAPRDHAKPKNESDALTAKIRADDAEFVQACKLGGKIFRVEEGDQDSCTTRGGQLTEAKHSELSHGELKKQRLPKKAPINWRERHSHENSNPATARPDNEDPD